MRNKSIFIIIVILISMTLLSCEKNLSENSLPVGFDEQNFNDDMKKVYNGIFIDLKKKDFNHPNKYKDIILKYYTEEDGKSELKKEYMKLTEDQKELLQLVHMIENSFYLYADKEGRYLKNYETILNPDNSFGDILKYCYENINELQNTKYILY